MEKQSRGRLETQRREGLEVLAGWRAELARQEAEGGPVRPETLAALANAERILEEVEAELELAADEEPGGANA
jgi:hypothetical protein